MTGANHRALQEVSVPIGCLTKREVCAHPCLSMGKPNSMADNPAEEVAIKALPTSANAAVQDKDGRQTCS